MNEELHVLKIVTDRLTRASIPYMITGSIAMNVYAVPRMTRDIDIVVELKPTDAQTICSLFANDFYVSEPMVRDEIARRGLFNISHNTSIVKVDCVVRKESEYRREEFRRRRTATIDGLELYFVSPEDLILSKLVWARESRSEMQLRDVQNLLAHVRDLDRCYLGRWADRLGVAELLREMTTRLEEG